MPVIPPYFDLKPVDKTKTRLNAVVKQAKRKDVGALVNACDAGREGELIFRLIEQYAGGAKPLGKPVKRLWLQSMTPQAIRDGFESLRSEQQMQGLADAARSRSEADWLVGINGTRAMTAFNRLLVLSTGFKSKCGGMTGKLAKLHLPRLTSNCSGAWISTKWPTALVTT